MGKLDNMYVTYFLLIGHLNTATVLTYYIFKNQHEVLIIVFHDDIKRVCQEYMAEGIPVDLVEFSDNRPILDMLLSRPMGLLALLDEESRFPCSAERSLIGKI